MQRLEYYVKILGCKVSMGKKGVLSFSSGMKYK